jgi:hypothetical protein
MRQQDTAENPAQLARGHSEPIEPNGFEETKATPTAHRTDEIYQNANGDKPKWTDKTVALFTLFLFLAAVIQGIIFFKQWQEMHSGGVDTQKLALAAETQAKAAKAQADEAKEQVSKMADALTKTDALIDEATAQATATNRLAAQAQRSADYAQTAIATAVDAERPWVGVSYYTESDFVEGKTAKILLRFTNSGKRPASATMHYAPIVAQNLPMFPAVDYTRPGSVAFLLPGGSSDATFEYELPINIFSTWKTSHQTFFILAEISYTDVGTNIAHITRFCTYYAPADKNNSFPYCTRFNEAK